MSRRAPPRRGALVVLLALLAGALAPGAGAEPSHLAAVVIDADSGAVLHAFNANRRVRPASLTKLMTALLVLEHRGSAAAPGTWRVSRHAAAQPASRLGLHAGREVPADTMLDAILVASANDAAVVAAEAVGGDEAHFVRMMNDAARRLGLTGTRFGNASGLPAAHHTTARDMAVLARHLWRVFPVERHRFGRAGMTWAGRWVGTTNHLIGSYRGARGMKTGFTCRAGFHLVAAAERGGRTLIAVVLGARTRQDREHLVRALLDDGFRSPAGGTGLTVQDLAREPGQGAGLPVSAQVIARSCLEPKGPTDWNIDVGVSRSERDAMALARSFIRERHDTLAGARAFSIPRHTGVELHRAIVTGLDQDRAREACLAFRARGGFCVIFGEVAMARQLEDAERVRKLAARAQAVARRETRLPSRR